MATSLTEAHSIAQPGAEATGPVRAALDRVLASPTFSQVERLRRFLEFITVETLAGRGSQLKEYLVGTEVFSKPASFDPRSDPIVRVQAGRLRTKLGAYYAEEGKDDPLRIDLPKGSYVPVFHPLGQSLVPRPPIPLPASGNAVLLLPFTDHSDGAELANFCNGLTEEVRSALIRVESLTVVPVREHRTNGSGLSRVLEAAEEGRVGSVVDGSVRKSGKRLRVTVHILDAPRGQYLWTHSLDGDQTDGFAFHEAVAQAVVEGLLSQLDAPRASLPLRSTGNLTAYNLYLKGRYHLNQRSEKSLRQAVECFEHAVQEDPRYALAHSGLADAIALLINYGYVGPMEAWPKAVLAANTAVLIDPQSAETRASLGHVKATQAWDFTAAEEEFQRAIAANPRYAVAHHWYGIAGLAPTGRLAEAIEQVETAVAIDPTSPVFLRDLAILSYFRRDLDTALDQAIQTTEQDPYFGGAYWLLGLIHEARGAFEQAQDCLARADQLTPNNPRVMSATGRVLALAGQHRAARKVLAGIGELAKARYVSPFDSALVLLALGDSDQAFQHLGESLHHPHFGLMHARVDPRFDSVRDDPRLAECLKRLTVK